MGSTPFALSVHNFISSVGADAGFASIIGLAILVLLYFAHARETSNLREQAADLAARLQDAEARLVQATRAGIPVAGPPQTAQATVAAAPAPAAAPATAAGAVRLVGAPRPVAVATATAPFAPAGMAAPALATATRSMPDAPPADEPVSAPAPPITAAPAPPAAPPAPAPAAAQPAAVAPATAAAGARLLAPSPVASAASPAAAATATVPGPQTAAGTANGGGERTGSALRTPPPVSRPEAGTGSERRPYPPLTGPPSHRSPSGRMVAFVVGALVIVGAIAGLIVATSGSGPQTKSTPARASNAPAPVHRAAGFNPATVTVAVLNGTAVNQLAHKVATHLTAKGYKEGQVATATDQTHSSTIVAYLPGFRADALHVAQALGLAPASVQPVDQSSQQVACPGGGACPANVVVTVGSDLAST